MDNIIVSENPEQKVYMSEPTDRHFISLLPSPMNPIEARNKQEYLMFLFKTCPSLYLQFG